MKQMGSESLFFKGAFGNRIYINLTLQIRTELKFSRWISTQLFCLLVSVSAFHKSTTRFCRFDGGWVSNIYGDVDLRIHIAVEIIRLPNAP